MDKSETSASGVTSKQTTKPAPPRQDPAQPINVQSQRSGYSHALELTHEFTLLSLTERNVKQLQSTDSSIPEATVVSQQSKSRSKKHRMTAPTYEQVSEIITLARSSGSANMYALHTKLSNTLTTQAQLEGFFLWMLAEKPMAALAIAFTAIIPNIDCDRRFLNEAIAYKRHDVLKIMMKSNTDTQMKAWRDQSVNPVNIAITHDSTSTVNFLLNQYPELISLADQDKNTPLHIVAATGNMEILNLLIGFKPNPNLTNREKETPIFIATNEGHRNIALKLLSMSNLQLHRNIALKLLSMSNLQLTGDQSVNPVNIAITYGSTSTVNFLLNQCPELISLADQDKNTPLHIVAATGNMEILNLLIGFKPNPNLTNREKETPIFIATNKGHSDIVFQLLSMSNLQLTGNQQDTLLHNAIKKKIKLDVFKALLPVADLYAKNQKREAPIHVAARRSHSNYLSAYIEYLESNNKITELEEQLKDKEQVGNTALHIAIATRNLEKFIILLDKMKLYNIPTNQKNNSSKTPLDYAIQHHNYSRSDRILTGYEPTYDFKIQTISHLLSGNASLDLKYQDATNLRQAAIGCSFLKEIEKLQGTATGSHQTADSHKALFQPMTQERLLPITLDPSNKEDQSSIVLNRINEHKSTEHEKKSFEDFIGLLCLNDRKKSINMSIDGFNQLYAKFSTEHHLLKDSSFQNKILQLLVYNNCHQGLKGFFQHFKLTQQNVYDFFITEHGFSDMLYFACQPTASVLLEIILVKTIMPIIATEEQVAITATEEQLTQTAKKEQPAKSSIVKYQDSDGNTLLHYAIDQKKQEAALVLLQQFADLHVRNKQGKTPFEMAITSNCMHFLKQLTEIEWKNSQSKTNAKGQNALHLAAIHSKRTTIFLIMNKLSFRQILTVDKEGHTPLHLAIKYNPDIFIPLMNHYKGLQDIFSINNQEGDTIFHLLAFYQQNKNMEYVLTKIPTNKFAPKYLDSKNNDGKTALHYAAHHNNLAMSQMLMNKGSSTIVKDSMRRQACHYASQLTVRLALNGGV